MNAIVGGIDYVVGGWSEYEINRRKYSKESASEKYPGRTYVGAYDVLLSVTAGRKVIGGGKGHKTALSRASVKLAETLRKLEDKLCDPDEEGVWECISLGDPGICAIPPVTSSDLLDFSTESQHDAQDIYELSDRVRILAAVFKISYAPLPSVEPLPLRAAQINDDVAVLELEAAVAPHAASLENVQAAFASRLDHVAREINIRIQVV